MSRALESLRSFFARPVCQRGTGPLRKGVTLSVSVGEEGPFTLIKQKQGAEVLETAPSRPDMTFHITPEGLSHLLSIETDDLGIVGVEITKLLLSEDPQKKMKARVHIGAFEILTKGYLGVIPLGGATLLKYLREKGFSGAGRIKKAMENLRT